MTVFHEKRKQIRENKETGNIIVEHIIDEQLFQGQNSMFAQVTLAPGCAVGYHQHKGNNETYYILSGKGIYTEDGREVPVIAGDVTFCPDGGAHGLKNTESSDLIFIALIATTPQQ